ncbi:hypothetical protein TNCV_891441 [Trichonephila clavipes]|nr:hypothetical protein TNCV_891441 [Trichonephila clavipes]
MPQNPLREKGSLKPQEGVSFAFCGCLPVIWTHLCRLMVVKHDANRSLLKHCLMLELCQQVGNTKVIVNGTHNFEPRASEVDDASFGTSDFYASPV